VALMSLASVSLLLVSVWGGSEYAWSSDIIIGLFGGGIIAALLFIWRESKAAEPLIPLTLFKNRIFVASVLLSVLSGIALFASILNIPQYQQVVRGNTPTESGLLMLPLVIGMLVASTVSGRLISRLGRYRIFPIIGTLTLTFGLWFFSHLSLTTSHAWLSLWMLTIGAGLGMFMQVPTLAVQNTSKREELGTATSTVIFFRSIGSSFGGAIFGNILVSRFSHHLHDVLPGAGSITSSALSSGVSHVPEAAKQLVLGAYVHSFRDMFLLAIPFSLAAFVVALFLKDAPLRDSTRDTAETIAD
jgi:MFS family permease